MKLSWQKRIQEKKGGGTAFGADSHASWQPDGYPTPQLYEHRACRRSREHSNMRRACFFFALVLIMTLFGCSGGTADIEPHEPLENPELMGSSESMGYTLTTICSTAGGSIIIPGEGDFVYDEGAVVDLVAEVEPGYWFVNWTGDIDTIFDPDSASTNITMNDDYCITVNFEPLPSMECSLTTNSTEGGEVTTPGEGTFTCDAGKMVNLLAVADEHYEFTCWTGDVDYVDDIYAAETTITVWDDYSITANFELLEYILTIDSTEGGSVTVPREGESAYPAGTVVELLAVADEHYQFVEWIGDVDGIDDVCAADTFINIWGDYSISAEFEKVPGPEVYSVEPSSGQPKNRFTVTIFGANFKDIPSVDFGEWIVVQQVTFVSASQLEVRIMVNNLAEPGPRDVTVTNPDGQSATLPDGFTVL